MAKTITKVDFDLNIRWFLKEATKISLEDFESAYQAGDDCVFTYSVDVTADHTTALDALLANHDADFDVSVEPSLSIKEIRDEMITTDLPNWATLSDTKKKMLVERFVYPQTATETELDALYTKEERELFMCQTVQDINIDTPTVRSSESELCYWVLTADDNGVMETTEAKSYEIF